MDGQPVEITRTMDDVSENGMCLYNSDAEEEVALVPGKLLAGVAKMSVFDRLVMRGRSYLSSVSIFDRQSPSGEFDTTYFIMATPLFITSVDGWVASSAVKHCVLESWMTDAATDTGTAACECGCCKASLYEFGGAYIIWFTTG